MICTQGMEKSHSFAAGIESSVAIEQSFLIGLADNGAKAKVSFFLLLGGQLGDGHAKKIML